MSWGAQNRSKDEKTPSVGRVMSEKPEPDCCPVQPYGMVPSLDGKGAMSYHFAGMDSLEGSSKKDEDTQKHTKAAKMVQNNRCRMELMVDGHLHSTPPDLYKTP